MTEQMDSSMDRVLHVLNTFRWQIGGGGEHLLRLTHGLTQRGYRSTVVIGDDGRIGAQLRGAGLPVVVLGHMGVVTSVSLASLFRTMRPDLIHLHGSRAGFVGSLAARLMGARPVIYTAHAFAFRRDLPVPIRWALARMEAMTCAAADHVICLTRGDVDAARRHGIAVDRATVIPNGVDVMRFDHSGDCRAELGVPRGVPVVGMVARLVPQKDPLTFVAIAHRVLEAEPSARILIVGDGPLRPAVEQMIRNLDLAERVVITGFRRDIPAVLQTMDVFVLTSRWEGLPFVVLEAMAAGRPVVAARLSGTVEAIVDGVTGRLVAVGDVPSFADSVVWLLRHQREREEMGRRAREHVERQFSLSRMIEETAMLYDTALASTRPRVSYG